MDSIESASALLESVDKHAGRESETAKWVREMLKAGHDAQTIAKLIGNQLRIHP